MKLDSNEYSLTEDRDDISPMNGSSPRSKLAGQRASQWKDQSATSFTKGEKSFDKSRDNSPKG